MINRFAYLKRQDLEDTGSYDEELDAKIEAEEERLMEAAIDRIQFGDWGDE